MTSGSTITLRLPHRFGKIALGLFVLAAMVAAVWLGTRYLNSANNLNDVGVITKRVSRHVVLPEGETPALLTVTDSSALTTAFLKQTKNDDKVLVYQKNKKAIIYRPSVDRIIDVGPVSIDTPKNGAASQITQ